MSENLSFKKIIDNEIKTFQGHTQKILEKKTLKNQNNSFNKFLKRHKIIRRIFITLLVLASIIFAVLMFSGGSLIDWILFGDQAEWRIFIFEVALAIFIIVAAIIVSVIAVNKKKRIKK